MSHIFANLSKTYFCRLSSFLGETDGSAAIDGTDVLGEVDSPKSKISKTPRTDHHGPTLQCLHCPYTTSLGVSRMTQHVMKHINYKPFTCPYCEYSAIQSSNVKYHVSKQHPGYADVVEENRDLEVEVHLKTHYIEKLI